MVRHAHASRGGTCGTDFLRIASIRAVVDRVVPQRPALPFVVAETRTAPLAHKGSSACTLIAAVEPQRRLDPRDDARPGQRHRVARLPGRQPMRRGALPQQSHRALALIAGHAPRRKGVPAVVQASGRLRHAEPLFGAVRPAALWRHLWSC